MSFSKISILLLIVGLSLGSVGGFLGTFVTYQPKIDNYEKQIATLTLKVSTLNTSLSEAQAQNSLLEAQVRKLQLNLSKAESENTLYKSRVSELESQVSLYEERIQKLESQISEYKLRVSSLESEVSEYQTKASSLQSRLDKILNIKVKQHYEWVYGGFLLWENRYQWDLEIPLSLYVEYWERPRPTSPSEWIYMAKDPKDDYYIDKMIQQINADAIKAGFTEIEKVNFVIAFVQSLPYTVDSATTPWNEYPRYPIETLFDRGGDCEDTSILVAALLDRLGYDVALLILPYEHHAAVGVSIEGATGSYYQYNDKKYFYLETTGEGWKIGEMPDFDDTRASVYPLNP